jgi:hypothetical protein
MCGFRFSITTFLVVITLLSIGLWAFVSQTDKAANLTYSLFLGLVCLATCGIWLTIDSPRRFWLGFAIFGWIYWVVGFDANLSSPAYQRGLIYYSSNVQQASARLITSDLLDYAETHLTASRRVGVKVMGQWRGGGFYPATITQVNGDQYTIAWDDGSAPQVTPASQLQPLKTHSRVAGHSVLGALIALLGGACVAWLFDPERNKKNTPGVPTSSPPAK